MAGAKPRHQVELQAALTDQGRLAMVSGDIYNLVAIHGSGVGMRAGVARVRLEGQREYSNPNDGPGKA